MEHNNISETLKHIYILKQNSVSFCLCKCIRYIYTLFLSNSLESKKHLTLVNLIYKYS